MDTQTTTLAGQQALLTAHIHEALDYCTYLLECRRELIFAEARKRHAEGFTEHGFALYERSLDRLYWKLVQDLADAVVGGSEYVRRAKT